MAKAKPEAITWIRYSQAKALASEYLGDPDFVEREIRRELAAGEIPWQCVRFDASEGYSGPGPGDPKFWKIDGVVHQRMCDGSFILGVHGVDTKGDSATRSDDAAAYGIELGHSALVRLKLLPPDDVDDDTPAKVRLPRAASPVRKARKQPQVDRVLLAIPKLFPNGNIDGILDPAVRKKVGDYLQPETKNGRKVPDRRSMNRALRQYRNRNH